MSAVVEAAYESKTIEYLIAVAYLVLFVPFWRYVTAAAAPVVERAAARRAPAAGLAWFPVPPHVALHPGHAWAAPAGRTVVVGLDDFADKLIGPIEALRLPEPGEVVLQGEPAWTVLADGKAVEMLSPLDGVVDAVNRKAAADPRQVSDDPYGAGWLLQVRATNWARSARQLLKGTAARHLMEDAAERLRARLSPELGTVLQDGGRPVHGIARELAPESWDVLVREFLLMGGGGR